MDENKVTHEKKRGPAPYAGVPVSDLLGMNVCQIVPGAKTENRPGGNVAVYSPSGILSVMLYHSKTVPQVFLRKFRPHADSKIYSVRGAELKDVRGKGVQLLLPAYATHVSWAEAIAAHIRDVETERKFRDGLQ